MNIFTQILNPNNPILYVILAWAVIWKGIALWHSARNNQPVWYIVILLVNTVGILEILYLVFFKKQKNNSL